MAASVGVAESTVYGYVPNRNALYQRAAATVLSRLDVSIDAASWVEFVDILAQRVFDLATAHPGLRDYVLWRPYAASTVDIFESLVARVQHWLPDLPDHIAWAVASRPVVLSLTYLGDPVLEPMAPWLRQGLLRGLDALLADGELPPTPAIPWQMKLRPPVGLEPSER